MTNRKIGRLWHRCLAPATGILLIAWAAPLASADTFRWYYKPNYGVDAEALPLALYSLPETLASYVLECNWRGRTLDLLAYEVPVFAGKRGMTVRVGGVRYAGVETLDPPDALTASRFPIPLDHRLVTKLGERPRRIAVTGTDWPRSLPGNPVIVRVVRECRALARGGLSSATPAALAADS